MALAILKGSNSSDPQHYAEEADISDHNNRDQSEAGNTQVHQLIQNVPYLNKLQDVFFEVEEMYLRS